MPSSLKSKLNRLKTSSEPRPAPPPPALMEHEARFPADEKLFSLSPCALKRLGFEFPFEPSRALFLDTETTGLSGGAGTVAFLVGLGRIIGKELVVRQYLMPSYAAEPLLLTRVNEFAAGCDTVVTFNGKSFDVPLLQSRHIMCRMDCPIAEMNHLDLIHPARRAWKLRLRDCSLSNLEEKILSMHREHDLPGSEVPERYFSFLKTGDISLLTDIVDHNRQDIVSLSSLLIRLCDAYAAPAEQLSMLDVFSMGKTLEKQGERAEARKCYRLAAQPLALTSMARLSEAKCAPMANRNLSLMLRREGEKSEAEKIWLDMIRRGQMGAFPCIELAKAREHRDRNYEEALSYTEQALKLTEDEKERAALTARRARLLRRIESKSSKPTSTSLED
ncbi:MAG: ribonuclease H-like domain-containing protein [Clostridia bacterium]|nr:ribonuclease H-like domain-containing protein [Clostridia bacterium]